MGSRRKGYRAREKEIAADGQRRAAITYSNAMNGRSGKLTPELSRQICETIARGNYACTACEVAGIHRKTYYRWLQKGLADPDGPYGDFERNVRLAEAERERHLLELVKQAAEQQGDEPGDWRAAAWMLERMLPERYGPHATVRHEGEVTHNLQTDVELALEELSTDELEQLIGLLGKAADGRRAAGTGEAEAGPLRGLHERELPALVASSSDR